MNIKYFIIALGFLTVVITGSVFGINTFALEQPTAQIVEQPNNKTIEIAESVTIGEVVEIEIVPTPKPLEETAKPLSETSITITATVVASVEAGR